MSKTGSKVFAIKIIDMGFILKQMECLLARKVIQGHLRSLEVKTSNFKIYTMLVILYDSDRFKSRWVIVFPRKIAKSFFDKEEFDVSVKH